MIIWSYIFTFAVFINYNYGKYTYDIKYLQVPLDHFGFASDNTTFTLRYLINDTFWKQSDGPIFFYTGNEGDIEMFAQNTGFQWEISKQFQALVVFAEHRYYGKSLPPGSKDDPQYYRYLSSQQAMADFVDVIFELKNVSKINNERQGKNSERSNPVIAFGGSYGGMLSAWMRMKYPAVIEGALASSAPILQFTGMTPCQNFYKVLTNAYKSSSSQCVENIRNSWAILRKKLSDENGREWIYTQWKLCTPINTTNDVNTLISQISGTFVNVGMTNYPYPTSFLMPLPGHPVYEICKKLNDSSPSDDSLLISLYEAISIYYNYTGEVTCLNWTIDPSDLGFDEWNIQSCTEMVMPMCTNGVTDMFEPTPWNFIQYSQDCYNNYKMIPQERYVEKEYGGKDLRYTSNIIFSNGLLDPWSSGGVTENVSRFNVVVILNNSAHHLDLRAAHKEDPDSVIEARKVYASEFRRWIKNYRNHRPKLNSAYNNCSKNFISTHFLK